MKSDEDVKNVPSCGQEDCDGAIPAWAEVDSLQRTHLEMFRLDAAPCCPPCGRHLVVVSLPSATVRCSCVDLSRGKRSFLVFHLCLF